MRYESTIFAPFRSFFLLRCLPLHLGALLSSYVFTIFFSRRAFSPYYRNELSLAALSFPALFLVLILFLVAPKMREKNSKAAYVLCREKIRTRNLLGEGNVRKLKVDSRQVKIRDVVIVLPPRAYVGHFSTLENLKPKHIFTLLFASKRREKNCT